MNLLKITYFVIPLTLLLITTVSAVVYDDEGKIITEDDIKKEMETLPSIMGFGFGSGCGCIAGLLTALIMFPPESGESKYGAGGGWFTIYTLIFAGIYQQFEEHYESHNFGRAVGTYMGIALACILVRLEVYFTSYTVAEWLMVFSPIELGFGSYVGYKIGKIVDKKQVIKMIKEQRRNQKSNINEKFHTHGTKIILPLLSGSF